MSGLLAKASGWGVAAILSQVFASSTSVAMPVRLGWSDLHLVAMFIAATASVALMPVWILVRGTTAARVRM